MRDQLDDRGMELVLVPLRRGAALEIADIGAGLGDQLVDGDDARVL